MGADRITQGPPSANGTNTYDTQAIVMDAVNGLLYVSGNNKQLHLLQSALQSLGIQTALTNITTAQTLVSQVFGPGALNVAGRRLRVRAALVYATTSGNVATLSLALTLGAVTLSTITTAATNTAASTGLPVQVEFDVVVASLGSAGTLMTTGRVDAQIGATAAAASVTYLDIGAAVSAAVNLLQQQTLALTIAASAAVPSAQILSATVEMVN